MQMKGKNGKINTRNQIKCRKCQQLKRKCWIHGINIINSLTMFLCIDIIRIYKKDVPATDNKFSLNDYVNAY